MEAPRSKPYEGPSGIGRDSNWLTNEDLTEGKDVTVEIEAVLLYPEVKFEGGRTRTNLLGLKFKKAHRVLLLNATNRKKLNAQHGNITKAWVGQKITLYVSETQMAGETVKCVRIRDARARVATATEEFLHDEEPAASSSPANGQDTPDAQFERACDLFEVSPAERTLLLARHSGDYDAAYEELQRLQKMPEAKAPGSLL